MNKELNVWYLLVLFLVGLAIYEFGGKLTTHLETVRQDYTSFLHSFFTVVFTLGLCISCYSILSIVVVVKQHLNRFTRESNKR